VSGHPFRPEHFARADESDDALFYRSPFAAVSSVSEEMASGEKFREEPWKVQELHVPSITLNDLLDREGVEKIDLLSMDIEGHEPEALAGFDIERFAPELVVIEAGFHRDDLLAYFERHGYERIDRYLAHDEANWYFTPRAESGS